MNQPIRDQLRSIPWRWRRALLIGIGAIVVFAVVGFFVVPPYLKGQLLRKLSETLHREVTIQRIRFNPFSLALTIEGLKITEADGTVFASWDRSYANYSFRSLFSGDHVMDEVSLINPFFRVTLRKDGSLNFDDLLAVLRAGRGASKAPEPGKKRYVRIGRAHVEGARMAFLDLSLPQPFSTTVGPLCLNLERFSTRPDNKNPYSLSGSTGDGTRFTWGGSFFDEPLRSEGQIEVDGLPLVKYAPYYAEKFPFEIRDGVVSVKAHYLLDWSPDRHLLSVDGAELTLSKLAAGERGQAESAIVIPDLTLAGVQLDLLAASGRIASASSHGGALLIRRDRDGQINQLRMFAPFISGGSGGVESRGGGGAAQLAIDKITLEGWSILYEDRTTRRPVTLKLADLSLALGPYDGKPGSKANASLAMKWNDRGTVRLDGALSLDPPAGEGTLFMEGAELRPVDPYIEPYVNVYVTDGTISARGHVKFAAAPTAGERPTLEYQGDFRIDRFASVDARVQENFLKFKSLGMSSLDFRSQPLSASISTLEFVEPSVRAVVFKDGTTNVAAALRGTADAGVAGPSPGSSGEGGTGGPQEIEFDEEGRIKGSETFSATPTTSAPMTSAAPDVQIGTFRLVNGAIRLSDRRLEPSVNAAITNVTGTVRGISSKGSARGNVEFSAKVDGAAPVSITGTLSPLPTGAVVDLTIKAKGIDLSPLGPYFGKYLGYTFVKGKLELDLHHKVQGRQLDLANVIVFDQLTLGAKTGSPDAVTKLPVKFGLACLKDREGRALLDVPVKGSLDDPRLRLSRVILHAIGNVLTKIVTSPFRALANAFGGKADVDLGWFEFAPGSQTVDPALASQKLDVLARSLRERPELRLDLEPTVDENADATALGRARLERIARTQKWQTLAARDPATPPVDQIALVGGEYPTYLHAAYDAAFPPPPPPAPVAGTKKKTSKEPPPPPAPPPSQEEMERALLEKEPVTAGDLHALATDRAEAVRQYLVEKGQVELDRLFLRERGPEEKDKARSGARVWFDLQ